METLYFGNVGEHKKKRQRRKKNCRRNQIQIIKIRAKKRQAHDWWQKEYRTLLRFVRFCVRSDSIGCPFTPAKPSRRCQSLVAYTVRVICVLMQPFNSCRAYKIKVSSVLKYQAKKISHTFIEIGCCLPASPIEINLTMAKCIHSETFVNPFELKRRSIVAVVPSSNAMANRVYPAKLTHFSHPSQPAPCSKLNIFPAFSTNLNEDNPINLKLCVRLHFTLCTHFKALTLPQRIHWNCQRYNKYNVVSQK